VFDVAAAWLLLILLSPLFLIVAVLIRIESSGPIIFKQERIGENGRPFTFLKFRSMRADTDATLHKVYMTRLIKENLSSEQLKVNGGGSLKMADDPRITRVGKIIRKTSIDELPQLINVLRGEMSLVGPRPSLPYEVELYEEWHKRRLEALPGITGWWQVKGRNRVSFDEMVRMDLDYIEHTSFWLDLKILLLTPWAALSGEGAG
jgi:exopolysaccharide biosynthesis polyprenyl glycosylphosphotransferase